MSITKKLKERYREETKSKLKEKFGYKNNHQVPEVVKIVINMGLGQAVQNSKILDSAIRDLTKIAGQAPVVTKAKKSIATYKLRQGMSIGALVTLRGDKMYHFLQKLLCVALPRIRDFRGVSRKSFDGRGNYSLGINDQLLFPEIKYDEIDHTLGMNITIVTTANTDEEALALLEELGMPFKKN